MPRIHDCFIFFNLLDPAVGRFVLCEAPVTFRGKPKPLHFMETRDRLEPFLKKIVHVVVDGVPNCRDVEAACWKKKKFRRNAIRRSGDRRQAGRLER